MAKTQLDDRYDVFISYSRKDEDFVRNRLCPALESHELRLWVDLGEIPPGADFDKRLEMGVEASRAFVPVLSRDWAKSRPCRDELTQALSLNKRVLPVLYRDLDPGEVPPPLQKPQRIRMRSGDDFDASVGQLIDALETDFEWRDMQAKLAVRTGAWLERKGSLLSGKDLSDAEEWLRGKAQHREAPTGDQENYIRASRKAASRRRVLIGSGASVALVVAVVLSVLLSAQVGNAGHQRAAAAAARSARLAGDAVNQAAVDPQRAVAVALQAWATSHTLVAAAALRLVASEAVPEIVFSAGQQWINAAQFSSDGKRFVTAGGDGTVKVWQPGNTRHPLAVFQASGHGAAEAANFDRSGAHVVSAGDDGTIRVWDLLHPSSAPVVLQGHQGIVYDAVFAPDGRYLASAGANGTVRIWDLSRPHAAPVILRGHHGAVRAVAFAPDSSHLVTAGQDHTVKIWDWRTSGAALATLRGHQAPLWAASFSPNGRLVISAGEDHTVRIWDWRHPAARPLVLTQPGAVYAAAFAPDGTHVAAAGQDGVIRIWDLRDLGAGPLLLRRQAGPVYAVGFDRSGKRLLSAGGDGTVRLWSWTANAPLVAKTDHPGPVNAAAFQPGGTEVATGGDDGIVRVWSNYLAGPRPVSLAAHAPSVFDVAFAPDGRHLAAAGAGGIVRIWDLSHRSQPPVTLPDGAMGVNAVGFSSNGHQLATGSRDGSVRIWNWNDLSAAPLMLRTHHGWIEAIALTNENRAAAGTDDGSVLIWNERAPQTPPRLLTGRTHDPVLTVEFTPDGSHVLAAGVDGILVWNARHPAAPAHLPVRQMLAAAALSPDGQHIVTIDPSGVVQIWDWRAPSVPPIVLDGHQNEPLAVAFAADGQHIVSTGADGTVHLWDCQTCGPMSEVVSVARARLPQ